MASRTPRSRSRAATRQTSSATVPDEPMSVPSTSMKIRRITAALYRDAGALYRGDAFAIRVIVSFRLAETLHAHDPFGGAQDRLAVHRLFHHQLRLHHLH